MAGICFYFEDSDVDMWSGKDFDAWNYACKVAGDIDKAFVINRTSQTLQSFDQTMDFRAFDNLTEAQEAMTGTLCFVGCPWDVGIYKPINEFEHAAIDWYIFGPASGWKEPHYGLCLPQAGGGAVHSVHAATAVMFYRYWAMQ